MLAHIVNGISILVLSGLILSYGSRLRSSRVIALSAAGLVFAVIAAATGATFMLRGQDDSLSLSMAMSFLLAFAVYLSEFHLIEKMTK